MKRIIRRLLIWSGSMVAAFSVLATGMFAHMTCISASAASAGRTYYVASNGSDSNDGLSVERPMSYGKLKGTALNGGDKVLFRRGISFMAALSPSLLARPTTTVWSLAHTEPARCRF